MVAIVHVIGKGKEVHQQMTICTQIIIMVLILHMAVTVIGWEVMGIWIVCRVMNPIPD